MSMRETIVALRFHIMNELKNAMADQYHGFSPLTEETDDNEFGGHTGLSHKDDEKTSSDHFPWRSVLLSRKEPQSADKKIDIFLQYQPMETSITFNNPQGITLCGHPFCAVRILIYDCSQLPDDLRITNHDALVEVLSQKLPRQHADYCVETNNKKIRRKVIGHALDLYIRDTGEEWNIDLEKNIDNASDKLAEKVVSVLKDLLPVAEYYFNNREALLRGNQ